MEETSQSQSQIARWTGSDLLVRLLCGLLAAGLIGMITWYRTNRLSLTILGALIGLIAGLLLGGRVWEALV